jgi:hypothetical protein
VVSLWWISDAVRLGDLVLDLDPPDAVPTLPNRNLVPCSRQAPPPDRQLRTALRHQS